MSGWCQTLLLDSQKSLLFLCKREVLSRRECFRTLIYLEMTQLFSTLSSLSLAQDRNSGNQNTWRNDCKFSSVQLLSRVWLFGTPWPAGRRASVSITNSRGLLKLDGRESEWTPGVDDGQGGLASCDSWGRKELDTTKWLNWLTTFNTPLLPPRRVGSRFLQGNLNIFLLSSVNNWCHSGLWDPRILLLPLAVICPLVYDFRIEPVIPYPEKAVCLRGNNECYKTQMLL